MIVEVPAGADVASVSRRLADLGALRSPRLFALYVLAFHSKTPLSPGMHVLSDRLSARALFARLARLDSRPTAKTTIVEGFNYLQIAERLEELEVCPAR